MKRKFGEEFITELEIKGKICSYCAEDSAYIEWLETKLMEAREATSNSKSAIDESKKFYGKVMKLDIAKNTITIESSRDIKGLRILDTFEMNLLGI